MAEIKTYVYSPVPEFDQLTQYVSQIEPVDMDDHYFVGIEVRAASVVFEETLEDLLLQELGV